MKCPYCSTVMAPGRILSGKAAFFWPDTQGEPPLFWATRRSICKEGGVPLWDGPALFYYSHPAWVCPGCKKLVAELDMENTKNTD